MITGPRAGPRVQGGIVAEQKKVQRFGFEGTLFVHPGQRQQVIHQLAHALGFAFDSAHRGADVFRRLHAPCRYSSEKPRMVTSGVRSSCEAS